MNLRKNIIQIAVVIQLVIIGITIFRLNDAEAFKTYPNQGSTLYNRRTELRGQETKSIMTSFLIQTCVLGVIVYLIKSSKNENDK